LDPSQNQISQQKIPAPLSRYLNGNSPAAANNAAVGVDSFDTLGLNEHFLATVKNLGFQRPTPIQEKAVPEILKGRDVIGQAQTGSGKTAAYGLPMIQMLLVQRAPCVRALIIVPTRELATQVSEHLERFAQGTGLGVQTFIGGVRNDAGLWLLGTPNPPEIVVGTPGRLHDLAIRSGILDISNVETLVLDEFDEVLSKGMQWEVQRLIRITPSDRQTLLFSATMSPKIQERVDLIMRNPVTIEIQSDRPPETIRHTAYTIGGPSNKFELLKVILRNEEIDSAVIFVRSKSWTKTVANYLYESGLQVGMISSDIKCQSRRQEALDKFHQKQYQYLVATDVVGRGIDFQGVSHIINFDYPYDEVSYVHRAGRTGRAGNSGHVITFLNDHDEWKLSCLKSRYELKFNLLNGREQINQSPGH